MTRESLQLVKGTLDLLILRTLHAQGELHGFQILDWIRSTTDDVLLVEEGSLYPALHRLEERGLLTSEWGVSEKGRRARYYRLTGKGDRELVRQEREWRTYVEAVEKLAVQPGRR